MTSNDDSETADPEQECQNDPWSEGKVILFGLFMYFLGCYAGYTGHINQLKEEHHEKLVAEERQREASQQIHKITEAR